MVGRHDRDRSGTDSSPGRLSGIITKDLFFGIGWAARCIYWKTAAGEQHSGWVEKETFDWNIMIDMNGFGASRG